MIRSVQTDNHRIGIHLAVPVIVQLKWSPNICMPIKLLSNAEERKKIIKSIIAYGFFILFKVFIDLKNNISYILLGYEDR